MIDYIKLDVSYLDRSKISKNEYLNFEDTYRRHDGVGIKSKADFSNITFTVVPTRIFIQGSLHKYYNIRNGLGDQNYTQFNYEQFIWVVNDLRDKFKIIPERSKILNLEYGVNLEIDENPSELLQSKLIFYKSIYPNSKDYNDKGYYQEFNFGEYKIKMYDKGSQYQVNQNILRFEVRTKKSRNVGNKLNILYLSDLNNVGNLLNLHKDLVRKLEDVFIYDCNCPIAEMTESEKKLFVQSQTPTFFHTMEGSTKYNQATRARKLLRDMTEVYKLNTSHKSLLQKLELKKFELLQIAS